MFNFKRASLTRSVLLCLLGAALVCSVQAGEPETAKQAEADLKAAEMLPTLYTIKDAKTGQIRAMTEAEAKAAGLPELLRRENDLKPVQRAKGVVTLPLADTFQSVVMIKRNPDGSFTQTCVETMEQARKFVSTKPASEADHAK